MRTFREFINEKSITDTVFGNPGFIQNVKDFFTGNWINPLEANKEVGFKSLKKHGFSDEESKAFREVVIKAYGNVLKKHIPKNKIDDDTKIYWRDEKDRNFHGHMVNIVFNTHNKKFMKDLEREVRRSIK